MQTEAVAQRLASIPPVQSAPLFHNVPELVELLLPIGILLFIIMVTTINKAWRMRLRHRIPNRRCHTNLARKIALEEDTQSLKMKAAIYLH